MHIAAHPVSPRPFTISDLYALPDDGMRHELIDGSLLVSPASDVQHQLAVTRLLHILVLAKPDEFEVLCRPGVRLSDRRLLQPDLVVGPRAALTADVRYLDARDVQTAVEVVSPTTASTDRVTKPALYAESGISCYIRIEGCGSGAPSVFVYQLEDGTYRMQASAHAGEVLSIGEPFPISFDPAVLSGR